MLRVFILAVLATGASAPFAGVFDDLDARVNQGLHDAVDNLQEGGLPAAVADLAQSLIPDNPAPASSDPIRGEDDEDDEADEADEAEEDETEEDENGVCDEADENGSCGVEEDLDDVESPEDEEAEEDDEFDEEEFLENEDVGDEEEEEGDDSGDGTNGDGEYDRRSEREQLQDPKFDQLEWVGHRGGRSSSKFKFDLRVSRRGRKFNGLSRTQRLLFCMGKTSNQRDAFDRVADFGEEVRSEWTHRDSIGVAIGQGSRNWARAQTHGESVNSLNLMLGVKRVNGEKINLADDWSSYPFDVRTLGRLVDFEMVEQDSESLELRPGPKMKCVWATGLKSFTLADSLGFSLDVPFAGGRSNTGNNIMKCWAGVDRMKNVLVFNGWPWARKEFGLVKPQVALQQFHAFYEFYSPSPVWKPLTSSPFTHRLLYPQAIPHH